VEKKLPGILDRVNKWHSWRWQMQNRIRSAKELLAAFPDSAPDLASPIASATTRFPMAITPYYASLIKDLASSDPIFRMAVPQPGELLDPPFLKDDPLEEESNMPVPGLVRRYPDRVLLLVTTLCATYCRYCTRKRLSGQEESTITITDERLKGSISYIASHPRIRDVLVSGGDPFTLSTERLRHILASLRTIPTVDIIRIGTRTPVTLPMRITDRLVSMLRQYQPIWINTHFNHPRELTPEASAACARLVDAGIPLGNQTVLLRGVNDDPKVLETLFRGLVRNRVRPYYLLQCDLVRGVEDFRTSLSRGIEIMKYLRGRLSGIAIPTYVVDAPGKGGKVPVLPNYVVSMGPTRTILRNSEGILVDYPEPLR